MADAKYGIRHFLWGFVKGLKGFREGFLIYILCTPYETPNHI